MSLVDLHLHSTFSDGWYTPAQLVQAAGKAGLSVLALTDHDSVNGVEEAVRAARGLNKPLTVVTGIELGTQQEHSNIHILGYRLDINNLTLLTAVNELRQKREQRLQQILELLQRLNIPVRIERKNFPNQALGRPHVAKAMVSQGYVRTIQEAFDRYLGQGRPAYVPQPRLTPPEALALIHQAGGLAFMAHPEEIGSRELVFRLMESLPWDGLEVYHPSALAAGTTDYWRSFALKQHLLISGGSDFHGNADRYPAHLGEFIVESQQVNQLWQGQPLQ